MTIEEAKKAVEETVKPISKGLSDLGEAIKGKADEATVAKLAKDLEDAIKKHDAAVESMETLQKEFGGLKGQQPKIEKSLAVLAQEAITEEVCKGLKKNQKQAKEIVLKAASTMTSGYALVGSLANLIRSYETEPGVSKAPDRKPFILDLITVGTTSSHTVFWTERTLREGYPGQVAEGGTFALMSTKYEKKSASSKKTAVYAKITEEMIEDVDFVQSEVQTEIMEAIPLVLDGQILTGDGTGENHLGILAQATVFAKPTGFDSVPEANNFDVIRAAILQIQLEQFYPTAIVLNPADAANMELLKDAEGRYLPIPFVAPNGSIRGVQVVENTGMAVGDFLVGDFKKAKLFVNRDMTVRFWDQVGNDPIEDLMTVTGSLRGIFRIKTPDRKAFVKGTFETAKALITATV